jgi:carbamoyl-phosphate synthase large subunit
MKKINVLITGAGSGVGQSIIKSLNISRLPLRIISADISELNAGLFRTAKSILIPKIETAGSLRKIISIIKKNKIDILMIGSEYELSFFGINKEKIENKTNCKICVTHNEIIKFSEDKYLTQKFLKNSNLPYLKTYIPKNLKDAYKIAKKMKLPIYLKNRFGTSSRNVYLIKKKEQLKLHFSLLKKPIIQEYAGSFSDDTLKNEYTCSFFKTKDKKIIGPFVAKRRLLHGTSWITEIKNFPSIKKLIKKIANKINHIGSMNIQLREGKQGPVPFEFNARFSGTTSIRAQFGFNEPEMFIKSYFLNKNIKNPKIKQGVTLRYVEEVFLTNTSIKDIKKNFGKGVVNSWF